MSNLLRVAMIDRILSLHRQDLSQRQIARELGINRETVARYLRQHRDASKPANAPSGSAAADADTREGCRDAAPYAMLTISLTGQ
jgi:IS30 family transposase